MSSSIQWLLDNDDNPEVDLPIPGMAPDTQEESVAVPIRDPEAGPEEDGAVGGSPPVRPFNLSLYLLEMKVFS